MIDLRLNLRHADHLNVQFVIDTADLDLDDLKQLQTARRLLTSRARRAGVALAAYRPFGSANSVFPISLKRASDS